jgi:transposase
MGDLLAAHEAAFAHFGGRCEFLLYDRMRTAMSRRSLELSAAA